MGYVYLAIAIVAEVVGTTAMQASEGFTKPIPSIVVVVGYGVAFYFLSLVLRTIPMGIAYAIWAGLGIVLIALTGVVLYKQTLDVPAMIGMGLIVAGVAIINIFSRTTPH
ncbi:multidrug resistance protein; DLP12 prophage [Pseudodesulfovibrio profundus]|uniref:Multidrug resistance protein DLP12 prophage n=1 Tax=Pseudodesulfovibrio profundus TaxID=57320 RepID=A0A2C8FAW6_9BACT|nr:multidrug efflux SMR transporter [Pseudodesulfovibrio profundus]MBC15631.1 QacE family quaternary ammonium compound efflux SMR transporter [Desulfovibrio sp.]SOB59786.1 multidrug resistance protein; DLP12 prophage [Pseudodesulfovibrio profundus]|tara:strand:+ start:143 stop:472 length:330 start_codon:yes stop_codon:yes gene_type:complete